MGLRLSGNGVGVKCVEGGGRGSVTVEAEGEGGRGRKRKKEGIASTYDRGAQV